MTFKGRRMTLVWVTLSAIAFGQFALVIAGTLGWLD